MGNKPESVDAYLDGLAPDRRNAVMRIRDAVLANLDADFEEGIQYGMIGYYVPHRVYPDGYHVDPKQPLPFAAIASQAYGIGLYLMLLYIDEAEFTWLRAAWASAGKKLDAGKSCIRLKKPDDAPLDVIGMAIGRMTAQSYIAAYLRARAQQASKSSRRP